MANEGPGEVENSPLLAVYEVVVFDGSEGGGKMVTDVHDGAVVDRRRLRVMVAKGRGEEGRKKTLFL